MDKTNFLDDLKARMASASDDAVDPAIEGLVKMGDHIAATERATTARIEAVEQRVTAKVAETSKEIEKVKASVEAGFSTVVDKIENLEKRNLAVGRITSGAFSASEKMLAAIPDHARKFVRDAEVQIQLAKRKGMDASFDIGGDDPVMRAASALWFSNATMAQAPKSFGHEKVTQAQRDLDRLNAAFEEIYGKAAYAEGASNTGGYLVPTIVAADILRIALDASVIAGRCRPYPMTSNTHQIPNEATGVTVYWVGEAGNLTGGENTLGVNTLTAKKLAGRATASIEQVEDSIVAFLPYVQQIMSEKIGRTLDGEILEGTGTNFTGVVTESSVNSVATTTTDGANVTFQQLVKAMYAAGEESTRVGAGWFMSPKIMASVVGLIDSNGQPIFQYANVQGSPYPTLLGKPVYLTNALSTSITRGATGSTGNIYFGDPMTLILGSRQDMRWDVSDAPNWATYRLDMRLVGRWGFTVGTPAAWTKIVGCKQLP